MSPESLENELKEATGSLLRLAREVSYNKFSDNCQFILSEIQNSDENFFLQWQKKIAENNKKAPSTLKELMPELLAQYNNLYDINLEVHTAAEKLTIVDIRCYLKSSLDEDYRQTVMEKPPMLHCKVSTPPWLFESKKKFDINWQHKNILTNWKLFWARQKLNTLHLKQKNTQTEKSVISLDSFTNFISSNFSPDQLYIDRFKPDVLIVDIDCLAENKKLAIRASFNKVEFSTIDKDATLDFSLYDFAVHTQSQAEVLLLEIKKAKKFLVPKNHRLV